jgi:hypothetical protein
LKGEILKSLFQEGIFIFLNPCQPQSQFEAFTYKSSIRIAIRGNYYWLKYAHLEESGGIGCDQQLIPRGVNKNMERGLVLKQLDIGWRLYTLKQGQM